MSGLKIDIPRGYSIAAGKKELRAVMRGVGQEVARRARAKIRAGGKKRASTPGAPPVNRSGVLARGIRVKVFRDGMGVQIKDVARGPGMAFYALFLEKGAKGPGKRVLAAHPFLEPALEETIANGLVDRVRAAVVSGIAFRKVK